MVLSTCDQIASIPSEVDAVRRSLHDLAEGDLLLILAEEIKAVLAEVQAAHHARLSTNDR